MEHENNTEQKNNQNSNNYTIDNKLSLKKVSIREVLRMKTFVFKVVIQTRRREPEDYD
jgi:hypothetical protein